MSEKINFVQKIKFNLWYFARKYPLLGIPIRLVGKISTSSFMKNHVREIKRHGLSILPNDRYKREINIPKQFYIIKLNNTSDLELKGLEILMNHFRIPYSLIELNELNDPFFENVNESLIFIVIKFTNDEIEIIRKRFGEKKYTIINFSSDDKIYNSAENIKCINESPEDILPFNHGLRSEIVKRFTNILLNSRFAIITGFLPPQIALRIDDVVGKDAKNYLSMITNHKWIPNLGVFINEFMKDADVLKYISLLNKNKKVEISPHAYDVADFIFYDFPNGKPVTENNFEKNWSSIEKDLNNSGFKICAVINPHFHVFSKENFELFKKKKLKYIFSEFYPSEIKPIPNERYLPSGDPLLTTGQINNEVIQIYSGDSSMCSNQSSSYYDFLMYADKSNKSLSALKRIKKRLDLTLNSGFASFITTHEYLINKLTSKELAELLNNIDNFLDNNIMKPIKTNLSEIGRACENHTHIIIHSIENKNGKYNINLKGKSNGDFYLTYFNKNEINLIHCPSFEGSKIIELDSK